nr:MAG: wsv415-like protein [Metapenaeopsis lamellata majanivirus]
MAHISLKLINILHNQRERAIIRNRLSLSCDRTSYDNCIKIKKSNNYHDGLFYDILAPDPLCPSDFVHIQVSIMHDTSKFTMNFLNTVMDTQSNLDERNIKYIENYEKKINPTDTKTLKVSLKKFSEAIRDVIFKDFLNKEQLIQSLFDIPHQLSVQNITNCFFKLDTYSKCILFLLYTHLLLEAIGSSIRFRIEDVYVNEFILVKRKCHISTCSEKILQISSNQNNLSTIFQRNFEECGNATDRILKYIINPTIDPPNNITNQQSKSEDTLLQIITAVKDNDMCNTDANNKEEENNDIYRNIEISINECDNFNNTILLRVRKQPRYYVLNMQLLFPVSGEGPINMNFLHLSKESKMLLILPYFFLDKIKTLEYGDSILRDGRYCTFLLADFMPIH